MPNVLIGRNEKIELAAANCISAPFLITLPAAFLNAGTLMCGEQMPHGPRDALVQQDSHTGASSIASERSKTRRAISRLTDGKHSRNSSNV